MTMTLFIIGIAACGFATMLAVDVAFGLAYGWQQRVIRATIFASGAVWVVAIVVAAALYIQYRGI